MANLYADNFDATTSGTLPSGWTSISGAWQVTTDAPASGHTKSFTATGKGDGSAAILTGPTASADMEVLYSFVMPTTASSSNFPAPGPMLRMNSGYTAGYVVLLYGGYSPTIVVFRRNGGGFANVGSTGSGQTFTAGNKVNVRAQIIGSTIKTRIWKDGTTEPTTWPLSLTDTNVTAPGYTGFYYGADGVSAPVMGVTDMYESDATTTAGPGAAAATAYTLTGPSSGSSGVASSAFTVAANGSLSANVVITPSDGGNGGTFSPTTVTLTSAATSGTFTYTPASTGSKTISTTNNGGLTNPASVTYTGSAPPAVLAPNDPSLVYSPGNWNVTASAATTINAGAYFRTLTSSTSLTLNFNVANNSAPVSQIEYRVDGYDKQAPWTTAAVASTIPITLPSDLSAAPYHLLEVRVKSTSETINRWTAPSNTAVVFTGISLSSGASGVAPGAATKSILVCGDSITEGVRTINSNATNDTDRNSAAMGWAYKLGELLGAEVGVIGFGATGLARGGSGNVPAFPTSIQSYYAGASRSFSTPVDLVVINQGTNDGDAAATTSGLTSALNFLLSKMPNTPIAVMRPFNGSMASALQSGISACSNPTMVKYIDTTGFLNSSYGIDSLNLHPLGPNDLAIVAPQVAAALKPILYPAGTGYLPGFRPGFH